MLFAQIVADTFYVPNYPIPAIYYTDSAPELPDNAWNHTLKYFPDSIVCQLGSTCGQVTSIFNCLTYMFNRAYDREADSSNIFPPNHTYNQITKYYGVNSFDSWDIVKSQGHPSQLEYETINFNAVCFWCEFNYDHVFQYWMNGYDNYYKSFFNRISDYYSLNVNSDADLKLLQHFFNNGFEENSKGGVVIIYINGSTTSFMASHLFWEPELHIGNTNNQNYCYVFDTIYPVNDGVNDGYYSHSLTIVGYYKNDSVDFNDDGLITDSIDINNDGIVDFHDNEKILWIMLNSGGGGPISLLKYDAIAQFWNQQVFFAIPDTSYKPELTFKAKLKHIERGDIKISAGISSDLMSEIPQIEIDFPVFNFQGTDICFTGVDSLPEPDVLEFGIDITDIKNYISEPGTYKIFIRIENEGSTTGEIQFFSILDYSNETPVEYEIISSPTVISPISDKYYSQIINLDNKDFNNHVQIINPHIYTTSLNQALDIPIEINFGQAPYEFYVLDTNEYNVELSYKSYPSDDGFVYDTIESVSINPAWDIQFSRLLWDSILLSSSGEIRFTNTPISKIELYPYQNTMPHIRKLDFIPYEFEKLKGNTRPIATKVSNNFIEIFNKNDFEIEPDIYETKQEFYTKITKEGNIEITYSEAIPEYAIFANIKTNINKYFIPFDQAISDSFNTVTFTPNPIDSLFTIDENGVLTMQPVSEPGVYETYVLVRDANGQEFTKRIEVNVITENIIGQLYPNPTNDVLFCDIYNPIEQNTTIEIFTMTGQIVYKETTQLTAGIREYYFNTSQFKQGVYLLKISMGDKSQTQRFVITK
jgi:hypothetical protein